MLITKKIKKNNNIKIYHMINNNNNNNKNYQIIKVYCLKNKKVPKIKNLLFYVKIFTI